jgi:excinuclease ABC subunit C
MHEVITRRFRRLLVTGSPSTASDDEAAPGRSFAYRPNLVVVDGGQPQVTAAAKALQELGIEDVALVGLAKRLEEVWTVDQEYPLILPRASQGLYLLQRIRDEAHRFAITYHRKRRSKAMTAGSVLDTITGVGQARRQALVRHFGSVKKMKLASVEELTQAPGVGPRLAEQIYTTLHPAQETDS